MMKLITSGLMMQQFFEGSDGQASVGVPRWNKCNCVEVLEVFLDHVSIDMGMLFCDRVDSWNRGEMPINVLTGKGVFDIVLLYLAIFLNEDLAPLLTEILGHKWSYCHLCPAAPWIFWVRGVYAA